jgi:hypothetical protein
MPGKTGKRAKPAKPCHKCGQKISGAFMREPSGDYCETCWWKKFYPKSIHVKS